MPEREEERSATLRRSVLGVLPEGELVRLSGDLVESRLPAGHFVYDPEVAIVFTGLLRAFIADKAARHVTISYLRPGAAIALAHLAGRDYPTAFQAVVDSRLLLVGNDRFGELRHAYPELGWAAARELSVRLDDVEAELARVAFGTIRQRLAFHTLVLSEHSSDPTIHLTQLMSAVGSPREVISRSLVALADQGIVKVDRGGVTVVDRQRLRDSAHLA
jgi:CRP-like cAMP-binding protein